jgi:hydroxymethylbilane synthase
VQLSALRPDLRIVPLRGNVDTRLRKLDQGELDAVVLARAGLARLGLDDRVVDAVDPDVVIPAPGQGALAVECRADDVRTRELLAALSDLDTEVAVACERGVMHAVGGNCNVPFGAHARREAAELHLRAMLLLNGATTPRHVSRRVPWPRTATEAAAVGSDAGRELLAAR